MDFLSQQESAIDRAFGAPPSHPPPDRSSGPDSTNAAAPMPRKRPTAKPATARAVDPNANGAFAADAAPAGTPSSADGGASKPSDSPVAQDDIPSPASHGGAARGSREQQAMAVHIDDLERQAGALRQQTEDPSAGYDPSAQAHMLRRLTVLMGEVQQMMAKLTTMQAHPPQAPAAVSKHSSMAGTPTAGSPAPEGDGGLRTTAKPFEPPAAVGTAGGDYGSTFGARGGAGGAQRYAPVGSAGFQAATSAVHWGAHGSMGSAQSHQQAPPPPPVRQSGCVICLVEFKRGRMKRYESDAFVAPGNYIVVEGDRGEDCGLVVHTYQRLPDGSTGRSETLEGVTIDMAKVKPETGRVRRIATEQEVERLHGEIATLERHALKTCRERVDQMRIDMEVVDCEYQFDRKKITFFFDSPRAVDFRELTKDLFKHFGARIWLENINSKVKNVVPDGALSHADKLLYAERGLRPPRR